MLGLMLAPARSLPQLDPQTRPSRPRRLCGCIPRVGAHARAPRAHLFGATRPLPGTAPTRARPGRADTGGGKTHTVLGSAGERGIYYRAAERLLCDLGALQPAGAPEEQRLFLHATACEIYNDTVYDLLGEDKVACTLRVDEAGALRVLRPAVHGHDGEQDAAQVDGLLAQMTEEQRVALHTARDRMDAMGIPSVWDGSLHSTAVTRADGLRSVSVHRAEDLDAIGRSSVAQRAVGTSTQHAQSSRSHAIMRLEVVNRSVLTARAALDAAKSLLPARKNALDNLTNIACKLLFLDGQNSMLRVTDRDVQHGEVVDAIVSATPCHPMPWRRPCPVFVPHARVPCLCPMLVSCTCVPKRLAAAPPRRRSPPRASWSLLARCSLSGVGSARRRGAPDVLCRTCCFRAFVGQGARRAR